MLRCSKASDNAACHVFEKGLNYNSFSEVTYLLVVRAHSVYSFYPMLREETCLSRVLQNNGKSFRTVSGVQHRLLVGFFFHSLTLNTFGLSFEIYQLFWSSSFDQKHISLPRFYVHLHPVLLSPFSSYRFAPKTKKMSTFIGGKKLMLEINFEISVFLAVRKWLKTSCVFLNPLSC